MSLLIDEQGLALLLERNRDRIGHERIDGVDTLFSGASFFISTFFASYADFGPVSGGIIKIACFSLSAAFAAWGVYIMAKSSKQKYGHEQLLADIINLNEVTHPFSIVAIRDTFNIYPNRFLLYYDTRWNCRFFPNYRTKQMESENVENIRRHLSSELKVDADAISVDFREERIQRKFSVSDNVMKCYAHRVYSAALPVSGALQADDFVIDGKHFYWMSVNDMLRDKAIQEKNLDVVSFVNDVVG